MLDCLRRSGYLLEGRLVKCLQGLGMFVEASQSLLDARSGVSREIDLVAESWHYNPDQPKTCVKTTFVIEAVNNLYPVVLLTRRGPSPNTPVDEYLQYKVTPSDKAERHPFLSCFDPLELKGVYNWKPYSQYCAFSRKKQGGDLMASHPDDLHNSLLKVVEYVLFLKDAASSWMDSVADDYWRIFQWRPLMVLQNDLYVVTEGDDGGENLTKVENAKLEYNLHYHEQPNTLVIDFLTESAVGPFVKDVLAQDELIEKQIFQLKATCRKSATTTKSMR